MHTIHVCQHEWHQCTPYVCGNIRVCHIRIHSCLQRWMAPMYGMRAWHPCISNIFAIHAEWHTCIAYTHVCRHKWHACMCANYVWYAWMTYLHPIYVWQHEWHQCMPYVCDIHVWHTSIPSMYVNVIMTPLILQLSWGLMRIIRGQWGNQFYWHYSL